MAMLNGYPILPVKEKFHRKSSESLAESSVSTATPGSCCYKCGLVCEADVFGEDDATPKERPRSPQFPAIEFNFEHLAEALAYWDKDDLASLIRIRDAVDARCKELEAESDFESEKPEATDTDKLDVPYFDDGNKLPSGPAGYVDWEISREIGQGRFGKVYTAKNRKTGRSEAVKVLVKSETSEEEWPHVCNEHTSLSKVGKHPNIGWLTAAYQSQERIYFFMDFCKGKDLFDFCKVRQQTKAGVPKPAVAQIFSSMALALSHCHTIGICHRDVKPENIIVQQDYTARLVDFGCACPRTSLDKQCMGSLPFIAPEFLNENASDGAPADVWSLGVVLLEMLHGLKTLSKTLGWDFQSKSTQDCGSEISAWCADPAKGLAAIRSSLGTPTELPCDEVLVSMLHIDPAQRPGTETLREGAWLKQFASGK